MFLDLGQWLVGMVFGQQGQQRAADQGHVGQQVGVAAAGTILAQEGVAPPMIAHFHAAPVSADQGQPAFRPVFLGRGARKVGAAFGAGVPGLFDRPLAAPHDQAARKGEVRLQRFAGEGVDGTLFHPAVPAPGLDKKGVATNASSARACWKSLGWLPLIWSR